MTRSHWRESLEQTVEEGGAVGGQSQFRKVVKRRKCRLPIAIRYMIGVAASFQNPKAVGCVAKYVKGGPGQPPQGFVQILCFVFSKYGNKPCPILCLGRRT